MRRQPHQLTLEEFTWRAEWLEIARLWPHLSERERLQSVRRLVRRARKVKPGYPFRGRWREEGGERSEWGRWIKKGYAEYLRTGEL